MKIHTIPGLLCAANTFKRRSRRRCLLADLLSGLAETRLEVPLVAGRRDRALIGVCLLSAGTHVTTSVLRNETRSKMSIMS